MIKKCIYCSSEINENSVLDVCKRCGHNVWGEKMFDVILSQMENARKKGDLNQGSVNDSFLNPPLPGDA